MVSIRLKLFSVKNGNKKHRQKRVGEGKGKTYNDFSELINERNNFPISNSNSSSNSNPSSSSQNQHTGNPSPKSNPTPKNPSPTDNNSKTGLKRLIERYKTDPEFKKKVNTGGYITLGTAVAAGAAIGGAKLYKKRKQRKEEEKKNEEAKNQILIK